MVYKVTFYTLAILSDGRIGNLRQNGGIFFTDNKIEDIQNAIDEHLLINHRVAVIEKIEKAGDFILLKK